MRTKSLQLRKLWGAALFILCLCLAGMTKTLAQQPQQIKVSEINFSNIRTIEERVFMVHSILDKGYFCYKNLNLQNTIDIYVSNDASDELSDFDFFYDNLLYDQLNEFSSLDKNMRGELFVQWRQGIDDEVFRTLYEDFTRGIASENATCETAQPFTANGAFSFSAGVNSGSPCGDTYDDCSDPYYCYGSHQGQDNCLFEAPNPAFYYIRITSPGDLNIHMESTPLRDIDFDCWGPFDDVETACGQLSCSNIVDCSYSGDYTENCHIYNAQTGEYYILLITNYSNQPCEISFENTGTGSGGDILIEATASPEEGGIVSGTGFYNNGAVCALSATANPGYVFVNWTENGTVVSTNSTFTFNVSCNRTLVANFQHIYTINVTANPTAGGGVTGGGIYVQGSSCTLMATANNGYTFVNWTENDSVVSTNPNYTFTVTDSASFVANFIRTPVLNVSTNNINFGEVALNQSASATLNVEGVWLENNLNIEITGEDAAMFSFTEATNWNSLTGGDIIVTFTPTSVKYDYHANLIVSSGTLSQTVVLSGSIANVYDFNTYVDEDVYAMNTAIPIHGSVTNNGIPMINAEVEIGIFVMGMKRTLQATTNGNGEFFATFVPLPTEAGYYTVNSGHVGNNSTEMHDYFNIPGMTLVSSDYILCAVTQDQPRTDSILIRNKSNLELSNIQVSPISVPDGATFSFTPLSLGGLEENWLVYTVTGSILTQGNYYEEAKLKAVSSEGAEMSLSIWYYCMEPRGVLDVMPKSLVTTMTKGKSKIVDVMLTNNGTAATGNIYIDLPDAEWMSVVGNDTLPSLAVNDTAYFSLRFSPNEDIPLVQYFGDIYINSERGDAVPLSFTITAVADSTGTLVIDVTDDFTWNTNNGNGPHLEGAEVTVKGYYSLETVAHGYTDSNGIFQATDLPEGYYRLSVTADRHTDYNRVVFVEAGVTDRSHTDVFLQYQAVTYSWIVEPTEIPDEYTYELDVVFETHVPAPVVVIDISPQVPELDYGESYTFNAIVTNYGLIAEKGVRLLMPVSNEYVFNALYEELDSLPALTTVVVPITVTRVQSDRYEYSPDYPFDPNNPCWFRIGYIGYYVCGNDYHWHYVPSKEVFINRCVLNALADRLPQLPWPIGPVGGGGHGSGSGNIIEERPPKEIECKIECHPGDSMGPYPPLLLPYNAMAQDLQDTVLFRDENKSNSVCSTVKFRFSQEMTMTREAFVGTFTVHNSYDSEPIEAIGLDFIIKDEDGNVCNDLFQINTLSLNNLTEIDGFGTLGASLDGVAKIQFIPTKYAAPIEPKVYYFGGTFSFIDPSTLDEIVYDLFPVEITVNPSPDLFVDYFMQRDILGDDALTEDVVEPSVPAELGVIIHNQGTGTAKNVLLETAEPYIIDNEKGLAIDFAMYGASLNGSPRELGLMEIRFGNIESGHTVVGEWLFTSSLLGHFVSYEAHVIHNSSYGNPDLSLVSHLNIHELIHPIRAYGSLEDGINDFLVNDVPDEHNYPDSIYFSNGGRTGVSVVNNISFDHYLQPDDTIVTLTVNPSRAGWNYGVVDDPGSTYVLVRCTRNTDNRIIPLNNVWQTFVTLLDEHDPIYENKLHIVDTVSSTQTVTYTLTYSVNPPEPSHVPIGAIDGLFSVSDSQQVYFSQGNLQYIGSASTPYWKFADNQWDYFGTTTGQNSSDQNIDRDLFGWGTSGYHNSSDPYNVNYQPWSTSTSPVNNNYNSVGYGPSTNMSNPNLIGTSANYDWGVYNPISNGGNIANQWRTLTKPEWSYVFNTRSTTSGIRYALAQVNNVNGVILLPDNWDTDNYSLNNTNQNNASFDSNIITASQWNILEQYGAVFLPAAGKRYGSSVSYVGSHGSYWSVSYVNYSAASSVGFNDLNLSYNSGDDRASGLSVRLVRTAQGNGNYTINTTCSPAEGGTVTGAGTYQQGQTCTLTAIANNGYIFSNWTENGSVVSTNANYNFTVTGNRTLVANFTYNNTGDHDYVDLGLPSGTLWATCNVGADTSEEYGDYFAWAETQPKTTYDWNTYQYCMGTDRTLTKYCSKSEYGYNGFTDNLTILLPEDDAATANWGEDWRMPTKEEWQELCNNTTKTWTTQNGVNGWLFTATNGNSLFLPAAGYCGWSWLSSAGSYSYYWSSSLDTDSPYRAWGFNNNVYSIGDHFYGLSVRPVRSGAINGRFSVSDSRQVCFSQGNLQYQASTNTWRFAENQWDCLRIENENVSSTYEGWIDLFGWGTSGYDHGATCYQPWSTSWNSSDYYAYGSSENNLYDQTGKADWGYNAISNGGNAENQWRTLTSDEWSYLFFNRDTPSGIRFAKAIVNDVEGLVVLPDNWDPSYYSLNQTNNTSVSYSTNIVTENDWASVLEPHGVLFLPAGSNRSVTHVENWNPFKGYYWASSYHDEEKSGYVEFNNTQLFVNNRVRNNCLSVRLVRTVQDNSTYTINTTSLPSEGGTVTGAGTYNVGEICTLRATANNGYVFSNWTENGSVVSTSANYTFTVTQGRDLVANFIEYLIGNNLVFNGDFELGNTGFNTDYSYVQGNPGTPSYYYVGHDIAEMWSGHSVGDHTTGEGLFMMIDASVQPNSTVWEQTVTVTPNTDYVFLAWFLTQNTGYIKFEINGVSGPDMTTPGSRWVWEPRSMTWNSGNSTEATLKIINRYAEYVGYDYGIDDIYLGPLQNNVPTGAINGIFSVSNSRQVCFAQGNLQYQATTNTWRFAENQWDCLRLENANVSSTYDGWIDLFGWGTSGYNHGATCYQPWSTSGNYSDYYAYGSSEYNLYDQTGKADWGYNAISNGGNTENQWRTLTSDEWSYLIFNRETPSGIRFAKAVVNNMEGLVVLPDNWDSSIYSLQNTNTVSAIYTSNIITENDWVSVFEPHGVLFLPAGSYRNGSSYIENSNKGYYWASTYSNQNQAGYFEFNNIQDESIGLFVSNRWRNHGLSVRLARTIQYTINTTCLPTEGGTVIGAGTYNSGETCSLTATANNGYSFVNWTKNGEQVSTDATYSFTVTEDASFVANFRNALHFTIAGTWSTASNWQGGILPGANDEVFIDAPCQLDQNATVAALTVSNGQSLTLQSGQTLIVTNTLTNSSTTGLVIEDGAQLEHASDNVSAMVKKNIAGYGTNNGKFRLISNPLASAINPELASIYHLTRGNYDLYDWLASAPDYLEWRNFKDDSFMMYAEGNGYLYANQNGMELNFPGTLLPSKYRFGKTVSYDANDTEHPGWNLIGNPFMCNAYLVNGNNEPLPYYRMNAAGDGLEFVTSGAAIAPMEGVFYQALGNGTVYFIRTDNVLQPQTPTGAINGKFTINANGDQVYFSQGNLQYNASTNTWRFAENQYDCVGSDNSNISETYSDWIDLFSWGTSGYNHGANCYQPWSTSTSYSDYYVYGNNQYNLYDQTGQADWGYNPISNGGNQENQWRTLTQPEWNYVFNTRTTTSDIRYAKANVNNVNGVILLPDDWNTSIYSLNNTNNRDANYSSNTLSASQWSTMEQAGAVFLPAAGSRSGTSVDGVGSYGYYWSASYLNIIRAYDVHFHVTYLGTNHYNRYYGRSVRLVCPAEN